VLACPSERLSQLRTAIQPTRIPAEPLPLPSRSEELPLQPQALAVLREPFAQSGPLADQRLVGDFGSARTKRDQASIGQQLEDSADLRRRIGTTDQIVDRRAPARVLRALAQLGQIKEDSAPYCLLLWRELLAEHRLGSLCDGAMHPAGCRIGCQREPPTPPPVPGLEQCM